MTPRQAYETHMRDAVESARAIRTKLHDTYMDYARQAREQHNWDAAAAFETSAGLALATCVSIQEPRRMAQ
jgi:hypothetical protein